ncbi:MAG TPA: magnesium chelatase [Opitutae bacterium]|nr:magnesium chelatase [Opitutae bacterium]
MLAKLSSAVLQGIEASLVDVEVNTGEIGELRFILVGLPDAAVRESQDRVFSALSNVGFRAPATRTTINLAPGHLKKEGPMYDLPIALGILKATGQIAFRYERPLLFAGELGLSGELRPIKGGLSIALLAKKYNMGVVLPADSAHEAALVNDVNVFPARTLDEVVRFLECRNDIVPLNASESFYSKHVMADYPIDFAEVKGQAAVKRAVEIAVAGGHNLLLIGPPGSGKSMIAKRIPGIMPKPHIDEFLEILSIQSAAGITLNAADRALKRPFRAPHHTISDVGLLGGGTIPAPGEISLAHNGVLFLDELPEFKRSALEVLRQPLEDGTVAISRSAGKVTLPSAFMLVAAMNPCPCGHLGDAKRECRCTVPQIQRYRAKISGPLLDRIDIHVEAPSISVSEIQKKENAEPSTTIRDRIGRCRDLQAQRLAHSKAKCNARMENAEIQQHCALSPENSQLMSQAMEELNLSARAYTKILKVARTIADLANSTDIAANHLLEAIQYRSLDRQLFY